MREIYIKLIVKIKRFKNIILPPANVKLNFIRQKKKKKKKKKDDKNETIEWDAQLNISFFVLTLVL